MLHALYFGRAKTDTAADYSLTQVPRQITKDYYLVLSKYDGDQGRHSCVILRKAGVAVFAAVSTVGRLVSLRV